MLLNFDSSNSHCSVSLPIKAVFCSGDQEEHLIKKMDWMRLKVYS